ncbi:MFS transporter, partial [Burkholderia multivorans]
LFLLEGIPSVLAGVLVFFALDDRIAKATWLTDEEKALLARNVDAEEATKEDLPLGAVMASPRVWLMALIYFSFVMGLY